MVYSGAAVTTLTAPPVITTKTTGQSFDFFSIKDTKENSCRVSGHRLWSGFNMGRRILAEPLHGGNPQHAAGQHTAGGRNHGCGFVSGYSVLTAAQITE